ncbi:acyl carrier protein, putative [Eimeria tenella]|uniref:Acyl carrier protein n=1 Tax=Eimeria tenella TaxID=5802 RepID=U6KLE4_EIMTE|nr:acyl carrier protein, putative [Eimeria tenella]CDJ37641.1 acyl carrier protein, putative [Eimeria tenella]|eukprot:XP_013228479.1 acyl carrier protein, putative [Eimeria tenella]
MLLCVLALLCGTAALPAMAFVNPSSVHFSYRYTICPGGACGAMGAPQGAPLGAPQGPLFAPSSLRLRGPEGLKKGLKEERNSFVLFAGEGQEEILQKVKEVVAEQLGADINKVHANSHFVKDLEADSLDSVELVMAFEEKFGVTIPDEEATKITTVQEAVDFIQKHK